MKSRHIIIAAACSLTLACLLAVSGCSRKNPSGGPAITRDAAIERKVDSVLNKLTLEQKAGQMMQMTTSTITKWTEQGLVLDPDKLQTVIGKYKVGSILNTFGDVATPAAYTAMMVSQIQPHFMYNSLTSIIYLCDKDTAKTKNALIDFSKYLRQNVDAISKVGLVSIKEELEHTKVYLSLEKLRFDDDLTVEFDIQDDMFMLPVLTLQPIVENAVKHGINASESGCGTICISTVETEDAHKIIVRDDGAGFDPHTLYTLGSNHVGIANVRTRLEDGCKGSLIINSEPDKGTECIILIPKEKHNENSGN